jgi:hypothetical protein
MDAFLERLVGLVPPPKCPLHAGSLKGFREVERGLGLRLPESYKRVIRLYGQGLWQGSWCIASPFAEDGPGHIRAWHIPRYGITVGPEHCTTLREWKERYPEDLPWPVYPEAGGLFSWGATDNAGTLYWLTEGHPNRWPTLHEPHEAKPGEWERFDVPFSELLYKTVARRSGGLRVYQAEQFVGRRPRRFRVWSGWPVARREGDTG